MFGKPFLSTLCLALCPMIVAAEPNPPGSSTPSQQVLDELKTLRQELDASRAETGQMRKELDQIRTQNSESWLSERRATEVRALIHEVLADADTRASLLAEGAVAGHNGSAFFLASPDGSFLLKFGGQIQLRYALNSRDGADDGGDWESGFTLRRVKLAFEGHIGSPKFEYLIQLAANRDSGAVELEDAMIGYQVADGLKVWGGRFMDKFARESMMSSKRQLTADRSSVANIFGANDGYVEGVGVEWAPMPDLMKLFVTINDGLNSGTPGTGAFQNRGNDFHNDATDIAVTARIDLKLAGDWKQNADSSSWTAASALQIFLGAALHYEVGETGDSQASATSAPIGDYDSFFQWTVDGLVKCHGFAMMAAVYGWHFEGTENNALGNSDFYAGTIQVAYMIIPDKLEPFARFEMICVDDGVDTNNLRMITAGMNWYIKGHSARFTGDIVYCLDEVNAINTMGVGLSGIGILSDSEGEDGQFVVRLQFQLLF